MEVNPEPRVSYFCSICDYYKKDTGGCEISSEADQLRQVNKGFCTWAEMSGRSVEMKMQYVVINGQTFRRGSKDLEKVIKEFKKLAEPSL